MFWKWNDREFDSVESAISKTDEFSSQGRSSRITFDENGTVYVGIQAATDRPPASNIDGEGGLITSIVKWAK